MSLFQNGIHSKTAADVLSSSKNIMKSNVLNTQDRSSSAVFEEGTVIKGEVIDIHNNEVTVKLDNNQTITAPLSGAAELKIGQTAAFEVVTDSQNRPALKLIDKNLPPALENTVNKALDAAGLPKNIKNQEIVRELLNNQLSIDKQSIQNILRQTLLYKDAQISTLVLMNKYQIPITDANVAQFEHYRNYEHRIVKEVDSLATILPNLLDDVTASAPLKDAVFFHNQLTDILLAKDYPNNHFSSDTGTALVLSPSDTSNLLQLLGDYPLSGQLSSELLQGTADLNKVVSLIKDNMLLAQQADEQNLSVLMQQQELDPSKFTLKQDAFQNPIVQDILNQYTDLQREQGQIGGYLTLPEREQLLVSLQELSLPDSVLKQVQTGGITTRELLSIIKSYLPLLDESSARSLISSDQYKALIKEQILSDWTLTPKSLTMPDALPSLYDKMEHQLLKLNQLASTIKEAEISTLNETPAAKSSHEITGLKQNLDFMKTLNELFTYVQVPVRLKDKTIHSDLYVYTNKKALKKNKNNISILLHLDMDYIGNTDIHITLNNNSVTSKFYLETSDSIELVKANINQLESALNRRGFLFDYELQIREKTIDIVEDFIKKDSPSSSLKRYSFDIRA